jgi:hypothetical protein
MVAVSHGMEDKRAPKRELERPSGGWDGKGTMTDDEKVDEASMESFPTSDPPSFTPTKIGQGQKHATHARTATTMSAGERSANGARANDP